MPKLKMPSPLANMAFEAFVRRAVECCEYLSDPKGRYKREDASRLFHSINYNEELVGEGCLENLRQGISMIKEYIYYCLPQQLLVNFCDIFLKEFYCAERPDKLHCAALKIMMIKGITGFRCEGPIMRCLPPSEASWLKGLTYLDLTHCNYEVPHDFGDFCLEHLTTFIFCKNCTNSHLETIAKRCPKLEVVRVSQSTKVTDQGLCFLSSCSELRVVEVIECQEISDVGLNHLLVGHWKLEEFYYGYYTNYIRPYYIEIDILPGLDWSVQYPSMQRFVFENNRKTNTDVGLDAMAVKFPNLVYLQLNCMNMENLTPLKCLDKLTGVELHFIDSFLLVEDVAQTWQTFKEALTFIGPNITTLKLSCWDVGYLWDQSDLNFIFDTCPDIEYLRFDMDIAVLVIPSFKKLKELWPCVALNFDSLDLFGRPTLKFGKMLNLETLSLREFAVTLPLIELIMYDNDRFPKLSVLKTICVKAEDLAEAKQIAAENNLDFEIHNDPASNWYRAYRFIHSRETDDHLSYSEDDFPHTFNDDTDDSDTPEHGNRYDKPDLLVVGPGIPKRRKPLVRHLIIT